MTFAVEEYVRNRAYHRFIGVACVAKTNLEAVHAYYQIRMARTSREGERDRGKVCPWSKQVWPNQEMCVLCIASWHLEDIHPPFEIDRREVSWDRCVMLMPHKVIDLGGARSTISTSTKILTRR
ncbi:hypothetical protein [Ktedonospora formicarum]|uniref:Uncharacterized protein n=1 Tax=Ktedonospora formicarum TaxID=2778364 RepID=A0A8J3I7Y4_9CHLR|nr:hypothetical protein [Ktedonospora formicarum]GHO47707.1 hypothetical protein KSX_58700 [Ktedonospora formicarum]